ncbi:MAG: ATP-binding protein, partial [FCB group bacterium]|nr:ATP-binding protein [FCB group bacterium]
PVYILGDPNSLEQAINAILENAVTYSSAEQLIHILLYADQLNAQCFLKISDEGSGMDEKQKQQIFDAYHFGEDIMYKHTPGLGLGLTIAKKILSLHSGRILVDSKPGSGTSVTIKLPIQAHNN